MKKGCYTLSFGKKKIEETHLADAGHKMDIQKSVGQIPQLHLGEFFTLRPEGRDLVEHHLGELFTLRPEGRRLAECHLGELIAFGRGRMYKQYERESCQGQWTTNGKRRHDDQ